MAIAYLQEFTIKNGDTSTTNYDAVAAAVNLQDARSSSRWLRQRCKIPTPASILQAAKVGTNYTTR